MEKDMVIRVGKSVRRITLLERDESGEMVPQTVWRPKKKKKKKGSKQLRQLERRVRSANKAQKLFNDTLLKRHRKSNRKRKDGWLKDMGANVFKAAQKSNRKFSKN